MNMNSVPKNGTNCAIAMHLGDFVHETVEPFDENLGDERIANSFVRDYRVFGGTRNRRARDKSKHQQDAHHDPSAYQHLGNPAAADKLEKVYRFLQ